MDVRTRYAPSPTGELHLGGLRTALYAFLLARHHGGVFFLRIEDTDRERLVPGSAASLMGRLRAVGLMWDEGPDVGGSYGPYVQSERLGHYRRAVTHLLASGQAYRCDCIPDRLEELREAQRAAKQPPRYDRRCRERHDVSEQGSVVRFRVPDTGTITTVDRIHGAVTVDAHEIDDFIILKSDGFPTYHLAHVVDDHEMRTTDVLRGVEWLPSLPKHQLLFTAFGWESPRYAHLPLLVGANRKKLSKRDGDTDVASFLRWCLPEALLNFVALLGWNPSGDRERYRLEELIAAFDVERVHPSPAAVNLEKLEWLNGEYIRSRSPRDLALMLTERHAFLRDPNLPLAFIERIVALEQARMRRLDAFPEWYVGAWTQEVSLAWKGETLDATKECLRALHGLLATIDPWPDTPAALEEQVKAWIAAREWNLGSVLWPMRVALSGRRASPSPFELAWAFGKQVTLDRIAYAMEHGN